jgi:hypothetical protein
MIWTTTNGYRRALSEKKYQIKWDQPSLSKFQFSVKQFFKKYWIDDIVGEEVLLPATQLRVDIINFSKMVAVEANGLFHIQHMPYFQSTEKDFHSQVFRDVYKEHLLEKNGFHVIEIYEKNLPLTEKWFIKTFGEGILD